MQFMQNKKKIKKLLYLHGFKMTSFMMSYIYYSNSILSLPLTTSKKKKLHLYKVLDSNNHFSDLGMTSIPIDPSCLVLSRMGLSLHRDDLSCLALSRMGFHSIEMTWQVQICSPSPILLHCHPQPNHK